jgi:putative ABC transport system permease protein
LSPVGFDFDDTALIPLSTLRARIVHYEKGVVTNIGVSTTGPEGIPLIEQGVVALLRDRHRIGAGEPQDFRIINPQRLIKGGLQSYELLTTLLEAIAAISFLVGGVGVTNVMLVGIVERKREIGICLAIGAGPAQIALQFLVEAVVLSLFGGIAGVVLGIVSTYLVSSSFGWSASLDVTTLTVGLGAAVMTGVAFGFVPALRAAQLDPIAAMRRD